MRQSGMDVDCHQWVGSESSDVSKVSNANQYYSDTGISAMRGKTFFFFFGILEAPVYGPPKLAAPP